MDPDDWVASELFYCLYKQNLGPLLAFAIARLAWPEFVVKDDLVFLKGNFSERSYQRLKEHWGRDGIECEMNSVDLKDLFQGEEPCLDQSDEKAMWEAFGQLLANSWLRKVRIEFPGRKFETGFVWEEEMDPVVYLRNLR